MPGPTPTPMEPMDTYLCVLLKLDLINPAVVYTQVQICGIIAANQTDFDTIYNNPVSRQAARTQYLSTASMIDVIDKDEECK